MGEPQKQQQKRIKDGAANEEIIFITVARSSRSPLIPYYFCQAIKRNERECVFEFYTHLPVWLFACSAVANFFLTGLINAISRCTRGWRVSQPSEDGVFTPPIYALSGA